MIAGIRTNELLADFSAAAVLAGIAINVSDIEIVELPHPHRPPTRLPDGNWAAYVFMHQGRCLKVGKAGPRSAARFCSQHYGMNAPSTLAKSLIKAQYAGEASPLDRTNVKAWICDNTDRINFLIPATFGVSTISFLEVFMQCRLRPQFEGFVSQRGSPANA